MATILWAIKEMHGATPWDTHASRYREVAMTDFLMLISIGWAALAAMFSLSIAFVVWGRDGDNTLKF